MPYDDEGFILLSLKSFMAGKALYNEIYSCYQPWFYECYRLLFGLTGMPVCHDTVRLVTAALWVVASLVNCLLTWRLTRSGLLALVVLIVTTRLFIPFANEPGHPLALCYVLLGGLALWFACAERVPSRVFALGAGSLTGLLLLTKVNVGVYAALPAAFVLLLNNESRFLRGLQVALAALLLLGPLVLMHTQLVDEAFSPLRVLALAGGVSVLMIVAHQRWPARNVALKATFLFALVFLLASPNCQFEGWLPAVGIFNAVLLLSAVECPHPRFDRKDLLSAMTALLVSVALICGLLCWQGTTLKGLVQGLLLLPAKQSGVLFIPWCSDGPVLSLTFGGLALAGGYLLARQHPGAQAWLDWAAVGAKFFFGLGTLFALLISCSTVNGKLPQFWMFPFAWILVIPPLRRPSKLGRFALLGMAAMQPLVAFPIAGSQLAPATGLVVVVAAVCMSDAFVFLWDRVPPTPMFRRCQPAAALACTFPFLLSLYLDTSNLSATYGLLTPLNLPGAKRIRLPRAEVNRYQTIVSFLSQPEVGTFLTQPGMNSLYLWAKKTPPTDWNVTTWMTLFGDRDQEAIWDAAQKRPRLMAVRNQFLTGFWTQGQPTKALPLARHIKEDFITLTNIDGFEVMTRRPSPQ